MAPQSRFKILRHVMPGQYVREYPQSTRVDRSECRHDGQERTLLLSIKQYVPLDAPEPLPQHAVTILAMHGNGFPKETYEPLFEDLVSSLRDRGIYVASIWIGDVSNQGDSGILNEDNLGDQTSWFDHARDTLLMVNHFRDQMTRPIVGLAHSMGCVSMVQLSLLHPRLMSTLILTDPVIISPTTLPAGGPSPALLSSIRRDVWPSRSAATKALGHSLRSWDPRALHAYVTYGLRSCPTPIFPLGSVLPAVSSSKRREIKSVDGATVLTNSEPDKVTSEHVTLTTTKHQEVWTFNQLNLDPVPSTFYPTSTTRLSSTSTTNSSNTQNDGGNSTSSPIITKNSSTQSEEDIKEHLFRSDLHPDFGRHELVARPESHLAFLNLPLVRPRVHYIFAGKSNLSPPAAQDEKLSLTGTGPGGSGGYAKNKVSKHVFPHASHLIPFEQPTDLAHAISDYLVDDWFPVFKMEDELIRNYKGRQSDETGRRMSQEWLDAIKLPLGAPRPIDDRGIDGVKDLLKDPDWMSKQAERISAAKSRSKPRL